MIIQTEKLTQTIARLDRRTRSATTAVTCGQITPPISLTTNSVRGPTAGVPPDLQARMISEVLFSSQLLPRRDLCHWLSLDAPPLKVDWTKTHQMASRTKDHRQPDGILDQP
jgi:hypothetical protein